MSGTLTILGIAFFVILPAVILLAGIRRLCRLKPSSFYSHAPDKED